jgi:hypothetical protein
MRTININRVIEDFNSLVLSEKEYALDIIRKMTLESRREEMAKTARKAMLNMQKGKTKKGSVKELQTDLESD